MIYKKPRLDDPMRQGDIFRNIPRVDFSLSSLPVIDNGGVRQANWRDILSDAGHSEPITAVVSMQLVYGIVIGHAVKPRRSGRCDQEVNERTNVAPHKVREEVSKK